MSTAPVPKSCLKPPVRNPWVSEDCGESSSSDEGGAPGTTAAHGQALQHHQYATPFQTSSGSSSHGGATHPAHTSSSSNSQPCSVAGNHPPPIVRGVPAHGSHHHHAHHHNPHPHHMAHHHGPHTHTNVPPSHTMQSLPEVGNTHGQQLPFTTAHSLHGTLPPPPQPWVATDHHMPPPWAAGAGGQPLPPGLFTVGQDPHWQQLHYPVQHHQNQTMLHHPLLTQGVSQYPARPTELSRCEQCHAHCFRAAQVAFVGGIVTGFSLLVAGGVFHRQHGQHLQVLVYIGALVSLVCVVLLVIFCAMNKDFRRSRRGCGPHGTAMRLAALDPESVPLRHVEVSPVILPSSDTKHTQNSCIVKGCNPNMCSAVSNSGPCIMVPNSHNVILHGSTNHTHTTGCLLASQGPNMMAAEHQHFAQARHVNQRSYDEDVHRYNQLWKQQEAEAPPTTTTTAHPPHHSSSSTTHKSTSEAVTNF